MKLRLPLALQTILLASMVSGISYATTTPPADQEQTDTPQVSVKWAPSPAAAQEEEAATEGDKEGKGNKGEVSLEELQQKAPITHSAVTPQPIRDIMDERRKAAVGPGGYKGNISSRRISANKTLFTFTIGKGEAFSITVDDADTLAYWHRPEGYDPAYFPQRFFYDGYPGMIMVGPARAWKRTTAQKDKDDNNTSGTGSGSSTGTGTGAASGAPAVSFSTPSFGGFGGGGGGVSAPRRSSKPASVTKPVASDTEDKDKDKGDEDQATTDDTQLTPDGTTTTPAEGASTPDATLAQGFQPVAIPAAQPSLALALPGGFTTLLGATTSFGSGGTVENGAITSMGTGVTQATLDRALENGAGWSPEGSEETYVVFNVASSQTNQYWNKTANVNTPLEITSNLKIGAEADAGELGLWTTDGYSSYTVLFSGKIIGDGTIGAKNGANQLFKFAGDISGFDGTFKLANNGARMVFSSGTVGSVNSKIVFTASAMAVFDGEAGDTINVNSSIERTGNHSSTIVIAGAADVNFLNTTAISTLTFGNGTTLIASSNNGEIYVTRTGGTVTFTNGSIGTITGNAYTFIKDGAGTLTLTGNNSGASGNVIARGGELILQGDNTGWGSLTVENGGKLTLTDNATFANGITVKNGGLLSMADDNAWFTTPAGAITLENGGKLQLADIYTDGQTFDMSAAVAAGKLDISDVANSLYGLTVRQSASMTDGVLTISGGAQNLTWNGGASDKWNTSTDNTPWTNAGEAADYFAIHDSVTFATAGAQVTVEGEVAPESVAINAATTLTGGTVRTKSLTIASGTTLTLTGGNETVVGTTVTTNGSIHIEGTGTMTTLQGLYLEGTNSHSSVSGGLLSVNADRLSLKNGAQMEVTGGRVDTTRLLVHDTDSTASEIFTVSGGIVNVTSAGDANSNAAAILIGHYPGNNTTTSLNIEGQGVLNMLNGGMQIGWDSNGNMSISGGEANLRYIQFAASGRNGTGVLSISGGRLNVGAQGINAGKPASQFKATGGTIGTLVTNEWIFSQAINLESGKLTFDTGVRVAHENSASTAMEDEERQAVAGSIRVSSTISGAGGLDKTGAGVLTLSGNNTATGALTVAGGELILTGDNSHWSVTTVQDGALLTLTSTATFGAISVESGGELSLTKDNAWFTDADASGSLTFTTGAKLKLADSYKDGDTFDFSSHIADSKLTGFTGDNVAGLTGRQRAVLDEATGILTINGTALTWGGGATGTWNTVENNTPWQDDQYFMTQDCVTFSTEGADITVQDTVTPDRITISAATTFTGGTVMADRLELASTLTISGTTVSTGTLNVKTAGGIYGGTVTADKTNLSAGLTLTGATLTTGELNVVTDTSVSGTVNASNLYFGDSHTLTLDSGVTPETITVAAGKTATLAANGAYSKTANLTLGANSTFVLGDNVTIDLNGKDLTLPSTAKIRIDGDNAYFKRSDSGHSFTVSKRDGLAADEYSTYEMSGGDGGLFNTSTSITNATVEFLSYRHVKAALTNCDVLTGTADGNRFITAQSLRNLTVRGGTAIESNMSIAGTLDVYAGKTLSVKTGSAKLTLNGTAAVNGTLTVLGALEIDMTGRIAGSGAIIDASAGTLKFTETVDNVEYTGRISLLNYDGLENGRYNLIQTNTATADAIVGKFTDYFTNTADHLYEVSQTDGLVQLVITAADVNPVTLTEATSWAHDIGYSVKKPVTVGNGVELTIVKGTSAFNDTSSLTLGDITLGTGAGLRFTSTEEAPLEVTARTIRTTDKPTVESPVTMGSGSTLQTDAGSWYFQGDITVAGDATITNKGAEGVAYGAINSEEDAPHTLTFSPENNNADGNGQVVAFTQTGTFSGTVDLQAATGTGTGGVRYVIDAAGAFQNAEVKLTNGADLAFDVETADVRKLSGTGSLISNGGESGGDYTGVTTLNVAEASSFSGTVGANVSLVMGTDAALQLTGATVAAGGSITGSDLTLDATSVAGTVNLAAGGTASLVNGTTLNGTLVLDLTGLPQNGTAIVTASDCTVGDNCVISLAHIEDLASGTYNLISTDSASAATLKGKVDILRIADHRVNILTATENGLQLDVHAIANPVAGQLYKWNGATDGTLMHAGSYVVAEYDDSTKTVYLSEEDVLQGWDNATGTGTQQGNTVQDVFHTDNASVGSLLLAADYAGNHAIQLPGWQNTYLGGIVVEGGAENYSISEPGANTRIVTIGTTTGMSNSYIHEDFTLTTGTTGNSKTILRGVQDILIEEGKTFTITNAVTNSGTLTLSGGGTLAIGGSVTNSGVITVDGNDKLTAGNILVTGSGSRLNMTGGTLSTTLLNLHNNAEVNVSGGLMTVSRLVLHDTANGATAETMNISGGVVTVTSDNNSDATSAALLVSHWQDATAVNLNVSGNGVLNVVPGRLLVGWDSKGALNISGGEVNARTLSLNSQRDNGSSVTLGGGRLNIGQGGVINGGSKSSFTISGGTLGTLTSEEWSFARNATLNVAGENVFTIDTQVRTTHSDRASTQTDTAGNIKFTGVLSGTGNVEKTGAGKATFAGADTVTGNLHVAAGTVEFQNAGGNNWGEITVDIGATLTYAANSTKTGISNVTNNGTLQVGNSTTIAAGQSMAGNGAVAVLGGGRLTVGDGTGLASASRITVNSNATLDLSGGFTQSAGQHLTNNGTLLLGGTVSLLSAQSTLINNAGTITLAQGIKFNMDAWASQLAPGAQLTKTFTFISGLGEVNGTGALSIKDFYLNGTNLVASDNIRSISMDSQGRITVQYWSTQNTDQYDESTNLTEVVLRDNNPKTIVVSAGNNVTLDSLTTYYTVNKGVTTYHPGDYSFTKRGEGTLTVLSVPSGQIDNFTVTNGKVVFGAAPGEGEYDTVAVDALRVHYTAATGSEPAGTNYYVFDEGQRVYTPATDAQIAAGSGLYTRSYESVTVEKITPKTNSETGAPYGTKVVFDIGASRLTSMGGSVENVIYDYATHRVTSVNPDKPAIMTDVELRLGNIINNDTSLVNVQFAGASGLSGFVTVDQAGDNDKGANISVAAGATLTIGTATNSKLAFNFMPGTITDHGVNGDVTAWDHHLIDLGQDSNLINWDNNHVAFYYDGILTKGIISIGEASDSNDHLGVAHIDTNKAPELLWNGTGAAWNPTNTTSTYWTAGARPDDFTATGGYDASGVLQHTWNGGDSRFYALSNVHFNTLASGLNSDIRLGQSLTVMDFTIGVKVNDAIYGDSNRNGVQDTGEIWTMPTTYTDVLGASHSVYNDTAYSFSDGTMRVLRDFYVRTNADLTFEGNFNIEARRMYLYNANPEASVTFGGTLRTESLTIGQTGIDSDCYGIYTFNQAVTVGYDLYIHVDSTKDVSANEDQVVFNNALTVGRDAMVSGIGSKMFKGKVNIAGDLTVSNCRFAKEIDLNATSAFARFTDVLTVGGNLILKNGGTLWLTNTGSQIKGVVQVENGTLHVLSGSRGTFGNGGSNFTFQLLGDDGHLNVSPNTYAHIASLRSTDVDEETGHIIDHDFSIEGNSRETQVYDMAHVKNLAINGGLVVLKGNTDNKSNRGGIHGDLTVSSAGTLEIQADDIFSHTPEYGQAEDGHDHGGHTFSVAGSVTVAAGTTQTMTDGSRIVLDNGIISAPRTTSTGKALFQAQGDMAIDFTGNATFGADLAVAPGEDAQHLHTLAITDQAGDHNSLLTLNGAISAGENAVIDIAAGTHVHLNDKAASLSGEVIIHSVAADELNFLNSALTVTQEGQITNARITVGTGATLDVAADVPVTVDSLRFCNKSTISLAALTGTKDLDESLSCLKVTGGVATDAGIDNLNLYFQDELKTMQTYSILTLTKEQLADDEMLSSDIASKIDIYVRSWNEERGEYEDVVLDRDQYDLKIHEGRTLYLTTFFGMIWNGGADGDGNGIWKLGNTDGNWSGKNWQDYSTAIFRDLDGATEQNRRDSAVTFEGDIHVDGIYVTADYTDYTFTGNGTTLMNVQGDDPDLTKNGGGTLTLNSFHDERFGTIDINRGTVVLTDDTIEYAGDLIIADGGTLSISSGSTLTERVYRTDADGKFVLDGDGHKILVDGAVGTLAAYGDGTATYSNLTANQGVLAGTSSTSPGRVSGAAVSGYTLKDITFSGANSIQDTTVTSNVTVDSGATLQLAGTTVFEKAITNNGTLSLAAGAAVDIGALNYTKDTSYGSGLQSRTHTYTLFTEGSTGTFATGTNFNANNVMINGANLYKYNPDKLSVDPNSDFAHGEITLIFNGVETPHWDAAWGLDQKQSPWLGHLILTGDGQRENGDYTFYDNNATSATEGTYRYYQLLAQGVTSQVSNSAVSIVLSQYIKLEDGNTTVFASGDGNLIGGGTPTGDIWVYDKGSKFHTKIAGYRHSGEGKQTVTDMTTHMVLDSRDNTAVSTRSVIGGSLNTNSTGNSNTYLTVDNANITIQEVVGGNKLGDLEGDAHVFIHAGHVVNLYAGSYDGTVNNVYLTVDGGQVDSIVGSTNNGKATLGDVHAQLLGGQVTSYTTGNSVQGDIQVDLSSKVTGLTTLHASTAGFSNGKRATLNLINENEDGAMFNMKGVTINGFDVINIGTDNLVAFDVRNFMTAQTEKTSNPHVVELTGTGRVIMGNDDEGTRGVGVYKLVVNKGIVLDLETCYIHEQRDTGTYPTVVIKDGATLDISNRPIGSGGGIAITLDISGHGVDGLGALYKGGTVQLTSHLTALPYINVKGNTSFGGTENFCSAHHTYGLNGCVNLYDDNGEKHNHTLTKQGSSIWLLERMTFKGGTLNIVDTSTVQLTMNSSSSPITNWDGAGTRAESSTTDVVIDRSARMLIDNNAYSGNTVNTFSMRSLSGNGNMVLNNSYLILYTDADTTDFYEEYRTSANPEAPTAKWYWNSEGYTYAVFGGRIDDMDDTGGNMVIKAGSGRQFLSGDSSTYDGTTRMEDGILYLMGTSYGEMTKGTTTVSRGVLGTSHLEWNGGTVTLGNGVRIYNNGQALTGAGDQVEQGVSNMIIRVNGMTSNEETTYLMVLEDTLVTNDGTVYHKVDTAGVASLVDMDGVYDRINPATGKNYTYSAGDTVDPAHGNLYVKKAENSMVYVKLIEPRYDDATFSGRLLDAAKGNKGKLVKVGLGTLTIDQYNSYTGGTDVQAGTLNVKGWGLLGGTNSEAVVQTAGSSLMLSYDGSYGADECFFINTDMHLVGTGDIRWKQELETATGAKDGYTAALISNVGGDFNPATNFTLAGTLQGEGNLLHMGKGTLYIDGWMTEELEDGETALIHSSNAGPNTYSGGTTVVDGRVFVRKDAGLGATAQGGNANLITLSGTEVHFEDSTVILAATKTGGYAGNDIRGAIIIGTADGTIRGTGAVQDGDSMQQVTGDVNVDPSTLVMRGNGYYAEKTKVDQDGTLVFQTGAASNSDGTMLPANATAAQTAARERAGYLEGTGALVLDNDAASPALNVTFSDIGTSTDGFCGNVYVQGQNATLVIDDGDYDATRSTKQDSGNITISGDNVNLLAKSSGVVITANSKLTLASGTDAWRNGAVEDTSQGGAAYIKSQYVTITEKGTLEVIRGSADLYDVPGAPDTMPRLQAATSLGVGDVAGIHPSGDDGDGGTAPSPAVSFVYVNGAGENPIIVDEKVVRDTYTRTYDSGTALNRTASGVVETGDYANGTLRIAANANLKLNQANANLNNTTVNLQHVANDKINLELFLDGDVMQREDGYSSQVVLFTGVEALYISEELIYGAPATGYNIGDEKDTGLVYVFQANEYFQNCWQITDTTLLVYDTNARVIYLDDVIPEPATGALSVLALAALAARRRRKGNTPLE